LCFGACYSLFGCPELSNFRLKYIASKYHTLVHYDVPVYKVEWGIWFHVILQIKLIRLAFSQVVFRKSKNNMQWIDRFPWTEQNQSFGYCFHEHRDQCLALPEEYCFTDWCTSLRLCSSVADSLRWEFPSGLIQKVNPFTVVGLEGRPASHFVMRCWCGDVDIKLQGQW
jgi:hypothetical protein